MAERFKAHACDPAVHLPKGESSIMFCVYFLRSRRIKWLYIGATDDLKVRFKKHNDGLVKSTKFYAPFDLVYYEAYSTLSLARKREYELKNNSQQKEMLFKRLGL